MHHDYDDDDDHHVHNNITDMSLFCGERRTRYYNGKWQDKAPGCRYGGRTSQTKRVKDRASETVSKVEPYGWMDSWALRLQTKIFCFQYALLCRFVRHGHKQTKIGRWWWWLAREKMMIWSVKIGAAGRKKRKRRKYLKISFFFLVFFVISKISKRINNASPGRL